MNYILCLLLFVAGMTTVTAHPPQKIYSITRQNHAADYYFEQARLWKQELEEKSKNANAWFNYFMAHQVLLEKGAIKQAQLVEVQKALQLALPQSFAAHFAAYKVEQDVQALIKAYELAPDRYETYGDLITHYTQTFQSSKAQQIAQKWLASGEYSNGLLHWNYNALIGLEKNALLLTEGKNYTQPLWLLQQGKGIRSDVQVLSLESLRLPDYRSQIFKQLGIPALVSNESPAIVQHLSKYSTNRPLYLGLSISKKLTANYEEELYLIGLAFRHSEQSFDNIEVLVENYEQHFLLDYLQTDLHYDLSQELVNQANVNYLPAFLLLYDYYQENKAWSKANELKKLSLKIADAAEKGEAARAYLDHKFDASKGKTMVAISAKDIEKRFRHLPYFINLYASNMEVSNADYELFLTDLMRRKEFEEVQKYKIYKTDWRSYLPNNYQDISEEVLFNNGPPDAPNAPIQNISYESAVAYCAWLTAVYNGLEDTGGKTRKRFTKVRFRLPTEAEWEAAALGKKFATALKDPKQSYIRAYSWFGAYYRNSKGCFLANFNTNEEPICEECEDQIKHPARDGAFFTTPVGTYFPNDWGLFNVIGNIAEMVAEKGKAKGGSWFHAPLNSTIQGVQTYNQPEPYIGFRVFMEVIEEGTQDKVKRGANGPPSTFHLKGNLYFDETELTNINWKEYVDWNKRHAPEKYEASLPDTTVWLAQNASFEPFIRNYYQHTAYNNYPVVGISHQQAVAYCQWRTERVQEMMAFNPSSQKKFGKIRYRLPTAAEWEYAASGGLDKTEFPYGLSSLALVKGKHVANLIFVDRPETGAQDLKGATVTAPAHSYMPNARGYYNMIGNVAEMIAQPNIAKGGSWTHQPAESKIMEHLSYEKPQAWLGFRCICETNLE